MKSNYITPDGEKILRNELRHLWRVVRPEWTQRVSDAAKEGDRSENAEYIYSKKKLREIDRRVRYLTKRLEAIEVVTRVPQDQSKVYFGAWVDLAIDGDEISYRLVGSDEFDQHESYISIDSPLARNLIGKSAGEEIELNIADEIKTYTIRAVYYSV
ncbi:MAG: transcription elongation factor GreB [Gammaproteobacteria bacterium]|jgi:transcription elongation factor GreB